MRSEVTSDETLNAICGIFEKPKERRIPISMTAESVDWCGPGAGQAHASEISQRLSAMALLKAVDWYRDYATKSIRQRQDRGHSNPPKSVHREAT